MIVLTVLGYILLGIGILLAVIILIPYDYCIAGEKIDESEVNVLISWLFGGIKLNFRKRSHLKAELVLTLLGLKRKIETRSKSKSSNVSKKAADSINYAKSVKDKDKDKHKSYFRKYLKKEIIIKILSVVRKIIKHCLPRKLSVNGKYGFDDPSYTGLMCAITHQFCWLFDKYDIDIHPVFDEEMLEGRFLISGRIWLPYLILVMIGFLITQPIRNIVITQLNSK